jgi:hypothetical protein
MHAACREFLRWQAVGGSLPAGHPPRVIAPQPASSTFPAPRTPHGGNDRPVGSGACATPSRRELENPLNRQPVPAARGGDDSKRRAKVENCRRFNIPRATAAGKPRTLQGGERPGQVGLTAVGSAGKPPPTRSERPRIPVPSASSAVLRAVQEHASWPLIRADSCDSWLKLTPCVSRDSPIDGRFEVHGATAVGKPRTLQIVRDHIHAIRLIRGSPVRPRARLPAPDSCGFV